MGHHLIEGSTTYDSDTLNLLNQAFDQAWANIGDRYKDPRVIQAKRTQLARIILALASVEVRDIDVLAQGGVMAIDLSEKPAPMKPRT